MSRKHLRGAAVVSLSIAIALGVSACGSGGSSGDGQKGLPDEIPVAMVGDMTGFAAQYGKAFQQGAQIAIDEVNGSDLLGGSKLKLELSDTGSDVNTASAKVSAATRSNAVAILGPTLSNEAVAVAPIAQRAKVPYLSDESSTGTQGIGDYVYNMSTTQVRQAPLIANYVSKESKKVALVYADDNPAMVDLKGAMDNAFKKAGVDVVGVYGTPIAATDFTALATKAIEAKPDAVGILGGGSMTPGVVNQLRTSGYTGRIFGNMGADGTLGSTGSNADGFVYPMEWVPGVDSEESRKFQAAYEKKFPDSTPGFTTMDGYDAVKFLALALKEAQSTDHAAVLQGMQVVAKKGFTSPAGHVSFAGDGNRQKVTTGLMVKYDGGKVIPLS